MNILFSCDYFDRQLADEMFREQADAFSDKGFRVLTVNTGQLKATSKIYGDPIVEKPVLYRGWMLNLEEYRELTAAIENKGLTPFTSMESYKAAHHLPNWYEKIKGHTPETVILPKNANLEEELKNIGWDRFFVKDYVKSLKTGAGPIITSIDQIEDVVSDMEKYRGEIEGGFCIRRVEDFLPETEKRYFVIHGEVHAPNLDDQVPGIVKEIAPKIESRFFSVDVIKNKKGGDRVVEIGDGQVSDIVGWTASRFVSIWSG